MSETNPNPNSTADPAMDPAASTPAPPTPATPKSKAKGKAGLVVRIVAKRDGFRRCGLAHPDKPTTYSMEYFTDAELKALQAEPMLVVDVLKPGQDE